MRRRSNPDSPSRTPAPHALIACRMRYGTMGRRYRGGRSAQVCSYCWRAERAGIFCALCVPLTQLFHAYGSDALRFACGAPPASGRRRCRGAWTSPLRGAIAALRRCAAPRATPLRGGILSRTRSSLDSIHRARLLPAPARFIRAALFALL